MLKIVTWNVNSIRARMPRLIDWIVKEDPDVLLLQETKCLEEQFPYFELESLNYNIVHVGEKARNGVAILSKYTLEDIFKILPSYNITEQDAEARYTEASFVYKDKFIKVASIYVPNGAPKVSELSPDLKDYTTTNSFLNKMKFYDRLKFRFSESIKNNDIGIFGADYNTCPELIDMYSPKKDGDICCNIKERIKFKEFLNIGMCDVFRKFNPNLKQYSWWGYRTRGWDKNYGLRLDAILTTPEATKLVKACNIYADGVRDQQGASDHVPMMCFLDL